MSDTNNSQFKQPLLTVLILLLFLLIGVQAWYMFEMKQQLDVLHNQGSSAQIQTQDTTANEKDITEKKSIAINNTESTSTDAPAEKPASEPLTSTQENQQAQAQPAQPQDKNVSPDNTSPLINQEPSDTTFGGQAWNPYGENERMRRDDMDRTFERRFNRFTNQPGLRRPEMNKPDLNNRGFQYNFSQNLSTPEMDVRENADHYIVYVNLPGTDKNDISVTLDGQRLSIKGKQDQKKQNRDEMGNVIFQVRQSGRFQRSITLSKPVDQSKMKTHLDNGVLKILIPKVKSGQWR